MFKKENLLKLLASIVILMIFGAIVIFLVMDPNAGILVKKEDNKNIIYANDVAM